MSTPPIEYHQPYKPLSAEEGNPLFDQNYRPKAKLLKLLELAGMPQLETISQINEWAQNNLLRRGERWQEQTKRFEELKPKIKTLLSELGFLDQVPAHFTEYQGAIVHGGLLPRIRIRLQYLVEQWKQGVRFSEQETVAILLDELARCIFQIKQACEKK